MVTYVQIIMFVRNVTEWNAKHVSLKWFYIVCDFIQIDIFNYNYVTFWTCSGWVQPNWG